jgi:hypothetical protein
MTAPLPVRSDVEIVYGAANIAQWALVDNDDDETKKDARITWAIQQAYEYIEGRLASRIQFSTFVTIPKLIFSLIAKRAGLELYSSPRGLIDGDAATAQLNTLSVEVEARIDQILSGQLKIVDDPVPAVDYPGINNVGGSRNLMHHHDSCRQYTGEPTVTPYSNFYYG